MLTQFIHTQFLERLRLVHIHKQCVFCTHTQNTNLNTQFFCVTQKNYKVNKYFSVFKILINTKQEYKLIKNILILTSLILIGL